MKNAPTQLHLLEASREQLTAAVASIFVASSPKAKELNLEKLFGASFLKELLGEDLDAVLERQAGQRKSSAAHQVKHVAERTAADAAHDGAEMPRDADGNQSSISGFL